MNEDLPVLYTGLQLALLALLPKDGSRRAVKVLAFYAQVSMQEVADALFDLYLAHVVDYDVVGDAFSVPVRTAQVPA
jgi:hypothetical protein